jgi:hypothetical protein
MWTERAGGLDLCGYKHEIDVTVMAAFKSAHGCSRALVDYDGE